MPDVFSSSNNGNSTNFSSNQNFCVDVNRVYDSCGDKDCLSGLTVYFTEACQRVIDNATSVRIREANIINTVIGVEPVAYHKGFYAVDMTFFFEIVLDVFAGTGSIPTTVSGLSVFTKRVILFGGDGRVAVFTNQADSTCVNPADISLPIAKVQVAQPMALTTSLTTTLNPLPTVAIPPCVTEYLGGEIVAPTVQSVFATIGVFTIVQLMRNVQMVLPACDFCVPNKECVTSTDNPCDMFSKVDFPMDQFFPPSIANTDCDKNCSCES